MNSLDLESTSDASSMLFPDGNNSSCGDGMVAEGSVVEGIWTNSESFFPEALLVRLGMAMLGKGSGRQDKDSTLQNLLRAYRTIVFATAAKTYKLDSKFRSWFWSNDTLPKYFGVYRTYEHIKLYLLSELLERFKYQTTPAVPCSRIFRFPADIGKDRWVSQAENKC